MPLNNYQRMCYRWFGHAAEGSATEKLKDDLEKAHMEIRAGAYISYTWFNTILAACISTIIYLMMAIFLSLDIFLILILSIIPVLSTVLVYFALLSAPASKAKSRGKKIELNLPYALNFISAMSSAGITPSEIFKSLSKQTIYGEIQEEALWIYRDIGLLGTDVITAIKANIRRTPSEKFKELLQGAIVTVQSGGALKRYFMAKADQYTRENRVAQKQLIESLGIMAEAYVTTAVAGILLIIIIIPLLMIISSAPKSELMFMYIIVFMICPMIHSAFAYVLSSMSSRG